MRPSPSDQIAMNGTLFPGRRDLVIPANGSATLSFAQKSKL
jgi:hypothetical protein